MALPFFKDRQKNVLPGDILGRQDISFVCVYHIRPLVASETGTNVSVLAELAAPICV